MLLSLASVLKREIGEFEDKLSRFESSLGPLVQKVLGLDIREMFADLMGEPQNAASTAATSSPSGEPPAEGIELSAPDPLTEAGIESEEEEAADDVEENEEDELNGVEVGAEDVEQNALEQSRTRVTASWKDRLIRQQKRQFGVLLSGCCSNVACSHSKELWKFASVWKILDALTFMPCVMTHDHFVLSERKVKTGDVLLPNYIARGQLSVSSRSPLNLCSFCILQ